MSPHFAVVQYEMYVLLSRKMLLFGMFLAQQTFSPAIRSLANLRLQVTKHSNEIAFRLVRIAGQGRSVSIKKKKKPFAIYTTLWMARIACLGYHFFFSRALTLPSKNIKRGANVL